MNDLPLKTKVKIITDFVKGTKVEDISFNERISMDLVIRTIKDWEGGFLDVNLGNDIPPEIKEIASMMRDHTLTVQDVLEGYTFYEIFKDKDKEKVIRIVEEIYGLNEKEREKFIETALKIISYKKYDNIEFTEIPKALEDMVYRGKELNKDIKSKEINILELKNQIENARSNLSKLEQEKENLAKELELSSYIKERIDGNEENVKKVIDLISYSGFNADKIKEISNEIASIKNRGLSVDQFLKISRYFEELMNLGLKVQMMEDLLYRLKDSGMDIDDYLNERFQYVKDKKAYLNSLKELMETHKKLEKDLRLLEEEIQRRKNKLDKM